MFLFYFIALIAPSSTALLQLYRTSVEVNTNDYPDRKLDRIDIARVLHGKEKTPEIAMIPGVIW